MDYIRWYNRSFDEEPNYEELVMENKFVENIYADPKDFTRNNEPNENNVVLFSGDVYYVGSEKWRKISVPKISDSLEFFDSLLIETPDELLDYNFMIMEGNNYGSVQYRVGDYLINSSFLLDCSEGRFKRFSISVEFDSLDSEDKSKIDFVSYEKTPVTGLASLVRDVKAGINYHCEVTFRDGDIKENQLEFLYDIRETDLEEFVDMVLNDRESFKEIGDWAYIHSNLDSGNSVEDEVSNVFDVSDPQILLSEKKMEVKKVVERDLRRALEQYNDENYMSPVFIEDADSLSESLRDVVQNVRNHQV